MNSLDEYGRRQRAEQQVLQDFKKNGADFWLLFFLEFFHFFCDHGGLVTVGAFPRIAVEEDTHHPVGGPVAVCVFQSSQEVGHELVEFQAFLVVGRGALVQGARFLQVCLNIFRDYFSHKVISFYTAGAEDVQITAPFNQSRNNNV
jgi:hypothetical protein